MNSQSQSPSVLSSCSIKLVLSGAIAVLAVDSAPAYALSLVTSTADFEITFTDLTFADATIAYTQIGQLQGVAGDAMNFEVSTLPTAQNYTFATSGRVTSELTAQVANLYRYQLVSTGGTSEYRYRYSIPIASDANSRFLQDDGWKLGFGFNPIASQFSFQNTVFTLAVLISGNWSSQGTNPGQVQFLGMNPNYTLNNNFVYNPQTNQTLFSISSNNWDGTSADVGFILNGQGAAAAAVPEPTTMLGVGLGAIALSALRLKKKHIKP